MTQFNSFYDALNATELYEFCHKYGTIRQFDKGEFFAHEGERCRYIGIVTKGYFKYALHSSDGHEAITGFALINEFVVHYISATTETPCPTSIVAGCRTEAIIVPVKTFNDVYLKRINPGDACEFAITLFKSCYDRYLTLYRLTPKERYAELIRNGNNIIKTVPLKELASYLMITPQYLSRIRRELNEESRRNHDFNLN